MSMEVVFSGHRRIDTSCLATCDMQFGKGAHKWDGVECVCHPDHDESIAKGSNQLGSIATNLGNVVVEVIHSLPKPHKEDEERCDADQEAKQTNPRGSPLDTRTFEVCADPA